jgi:hypothetical protein
MADNVANITANISKANTIKLNFDVSTRGLKGEAGEISEAELQAAIEAEQTARNAAIEAVGSAKVDTTALGENVAMSIGYGDTEVILRDEHTVADYASELRMTPGELNLQAVKGSDVMSRLNVNVDGYVHIEGDGLILKVNRTGAYIDDAEVATKDDLLAITDEPINNIEIEEILRGIRL